MITILLGLTFADTLQKDYAYVISAIGIKNTNGEIVYISGSTNTPNADGTTLSFSTGNLNWSIAI